MDNTFGTIVSYRPDIKVVDATLRDGGLVNNFGFTTEFVKDLYKTNIAAGVDYIRLRRIYLTRRILESGSSQMRTTSVR